MSIKSIPAAHSPPTPDATAATAGIALENGAAAKVFAPSASSLPASAAASQVAGQATSVTGRSAQTAREIELRHAIPKDAPLQSRLPGIVTPVVRADIDYLQMAAEASIEAQQAREATDHLLDAYSLNLLKASSPTEPTLEQQLWASIAFEFEHLQAHADALAGLQSTNRNKRDHLQRAIANGSAEQTLINHARQALEFDQKLGKKREEIDLSIACRDAVLEARLVKLGLLSQD